MFVDYQKVFITLLTLIATDDTDLKIIKTIYYNQTANRRVDHQLTDTISLERARVYIVPHVVTFTLKRIFNLTLKEYDEGK